MWRWPTVAGQKEASAKAKSKIYTIHAKLISIAAEKWSDPSINGSLADAITNAKRAWVTADVIDRAIKRWAGLDKDSAKVEEIFYEWYGPGGVGIILRALTDNRNRTAPSVRHIFSAYGWNMAETGSVSNFLFEYSGIITLSFSSDKETIEMDIMETDATDYIFSGENTVIVKTEKTKFISVKEVLGKKYEILEATLWYTPKNTIDITDFDNALKLYKMLEAFSEDEDIEWVWNNAHGEEGLWKEVESYIDERTFRT
jgi:YebC/PmpR family DNA-binding regulatory protein